MSWWKSDQPDLRAGQLLVDSTKQRVAAEYRSMLSECDAAGWKAGWHQLKEKLDDMVAAMDAAVASDDIGPVKEALLEYRKPVRVTWHF